MTTYSRPELLDRVTTMLAHVMGRWHQRLDGAQVRVGILMASNPDGAALKSDHYPVLAKIKVLALDWRVLTGLDAVLKIDETAWNELEEDSQTALLDHELSHLDVIDEEGPNGSTIIKRDDIGRPRLRTVPGDANAGDAFAAVIHRHGEAAVEFEAYRRTYAFAKAELEKALETSPEPSEE